MAGQRPSLRSPEGGGDTGRHDDDDGHGTDGTDDDDDDDNDEGWELTSLSSKHL